MSEKSFLMILGPIWSKIVFWKKKVAKFAQKCWKSLIFWISPNHKMAGSGRNWPIIISKHRLCPKVFSQFFLCPKPKNSWKYSKKITPPQKKAIFWGGGGDDIKCRFRWVWRSMTFIQTKHFDKNGQKTVLTQIFEKPKIQNPKKSDWHETKTFCT